MSRSSPITITTLAIGADFKKGLAACLKSKSDYATQNGYKYVQGEEEFWDRNRPIAWSKIPFLLKVLSELPDGSIVWQSDADVLITNPALRLEEHVLPLLPSDKDMLLTLDSCGHINSGNILMRNSAWLRDFWKRVGEQTQFTYHIWWENAAMIYLMETCASDTAKIQITKEHKRFNAYLHGLPGEPLWLPGDFLVHFAGVYDVGQMKKLVEAIQAGETPRINLGVGAERSG